jgi:23S rRNA (adenine2503-C2)-methyltransferase
VAPLEKIPLETYVPPAKPSLIGLSRTEIADRLGEIGVAAGAAQDAHAAALALDVCPRRQGIRRDDQHFQGNARAARAAFYRRPPEVVAEQVSNDGTRKWLLRLPSGDGFQKAHEVECVYIPETDRGTLCVSSQVGCTLNCSFCHTGTQRLVRNLTAGEIVGQIMVARDRLNDWADRETPTGSRLVTNVVMMGMGEPLYNFEAVRDALLIRCR